VVFPDADKTRTRVDCIPRGSAARLTLRFAARHRGEHKIEEVDLTSCYPLGFVRASKRFLSNQTYLVYPRPGGHSQLPTNHSRFTDNWVQEGIGHGDDFAGVRAYVPGESQRHIDWKAVARGQPLMTKQFAAETRGAVYLDFFELHFDSMAFSSLACTEILDGTQRLPASLCRFETAVRRGGVHNSFYQLRFC